MGTILPSVKMSLKSINHSNLLSGYPHKNHFSFSTPFEGLLSSATRPTVVRFMESFKVDEARIFTRIE
jgi:hypothetical protein